jgi:uncharacterized membrane protein YdjX (TVP38/TMEM64 family)
VGFDATTRMRFLTDWLASSEQFFQQLGWMGMLLFALAMAIAAIAMAPLSIFAIAAGMIFGGWRGFVAVELGTILSATINFLFARYVARAPIQRRMEQNPKFRAIDTAIGREGWRLVALLRFVPMPFGLMNYLLGLTAIPFWPYLGATAGAICVGNAVFAYLGATAHAGLAAAAGEGRPLHPMETVLMVVGLLAAFTAMLYVTKIARTAVARAGVEPT